MATTNDDFDAQYDAIMAKRKASFEDKAYADLMARPAHERAWDKVVKLAAKDGINLPAGVNNHIRTPEQQAKLIANAANNPNPVAEKGSHHLLENGGDAWDMNEGPGKQWLLAHPEHGFTQPVSGDAPHFQYTGRIKAQSAIAPQEGPKELDPPAKTSILSAVGHGAAQGATLMFGDEAQGLIQAIGNKITGYHDHEANAPSFMNDYRHERDGARGENDKAQTDHPVAYGAGVLGGAIGTAPATMRAVPGGAIAATVPGTATAARFANAAYQGFKLGGLTAAGSSSADATKGELSKLGGDIHEGAEAGGALGPIAEAVVPPVLGAGKTILRKFIGDPLKNMIDPVEMTMGRLGLKVPAPRRDIANAMDVAGRRDLPPSMLANDTNAPDLQRQLLKSGPAGAEVQGQKTVTALENDALNARSAAAKTAMDATEDAINTKASARDSDRVSRNSYAADRANETNTHSDNVAKVKEANVGKRVQASLDSQKYDELKSAPKLYDAEGKSTATAPTKPQKPISEPSPQRPPKKPFIREGHPEVDDASRSAREAKRAASTLDDDLEPSDKAVKFARKSETVINEAQQPGLLMRAAKLIDPRKGSTWLRAGAAKSTLGASLGVEKIANMIQEARAAGTLSNPKHLQEIFRRAGAGESAHQAARKIDFSKLSPTATKAAIQAILESSNNHANEVE